MSPKTNTQPNNSKVQLLSPVGSFDALVAAVSNGANAVYLGTKAFNARRLASNFRPEELKKAIQYAHYHNVKVYVTLNTLIKNHEIPGFLKQLSLIASLGADAVIMQDLSFAPLIKQHCPNLEIHASTQATIMNSAAVKYYQQYVDVFVLARELTHTQVKEIKEQTGARLEVFVHGHLCISYSGQCLISSLIGKRSGNRGMCASSCRKQYNGNSYLISAKDLCTIETISQFVESGVSTLKIEGRMKSPEYVATTTREYRNQIDSYYNKTSQVVSEEQITDLKLAFNRNFTKGYFNDEQQIVDPILSSKRGIFLGTVQAGKLRLEEDVELFDGISTVSKGERNGAFLHSFKILHSAREEEEIKNSNKALKGETVELKVPGFHTGAKVYLNSKHQGRNLLGQTRKIPISLQITITQGTKPLIKIITKKTTEQVTLDVIATTAQKHPLTTKDIEARLKKYESKIIEITELKITTDNSFVPKSYFTKFLQELEQQVLDSVVPIIRKSYQINLPLESVKLQKSVQVQEIERSKIPELHLQLYSLAQLQRIIESKDKGIESVAAMYFPLLHAQFSTAKKVCESKGIKLVASTPMQMLDKDISIAKDLIKKYDVKDVLINNVGMLYLCKELRSQGHKCQYIRLGYQMNLFNNWQFASLQQQGVTHAIASIELSAKELFAFNDKDKLIYYCHGRPIVMTFKEHIAARSLEDHEGYTFPLRKGETGATQMLYSKKIGILQHIPEILSQGIHKLFIDLEGQDDALQIISDYNSLLRGKQISLKPYKAFVTLGNLRKAVY